MDIRTGIGYDLHRLAKNRRLVLGGIEIASTLGLDGHSDADCLLHALCDALLGSIGEDDIGTHFPDTDPAYAGASSKRFVIDAADMVRQKGYRISNVDCIIFAEAPRLGAIKPDIRRELARMLGIPEDRIAIKAKSGENVGVIGRSEAIAAMVTVLIIRGER